MNLDKMWAATAAARAAAERASEVAVWAAKAVEWIERAEGV